MKYRFIICLLCSFSLYGDFLLEGKAGYFYPTDSTIRGIIGEGGVYSLEGNFSLSDCLYGFVSGGYFYKSGQSTLTDSKTKVTLVPLNFGLKYFYRCFCLKPYLGFGLNVSYLHTENDSPFVIHTRTKWDAGFIAKGGFLYDITRCFFLDVFVDYTYLKMHFKSGDGVIGRDADLSSVAVGGGLGYRF